MSTIDFTPCSRKRTPAYPTRLAALEDPNLLSRHVPRAWLGRREIAGAMGMLLAANAAGCSHESASPRAASGGGGNGGMPTAIAAPVSEHGSGIGWGRAVPTSTHTIAIYASEEDARQLIREQLAEAGIELDASDHILPAIQIRGSEYRQRHDWLGNLPREYLVSYEAPLVVDLYDSKLHIAIEYVSADDFYVLGGTAGEGIASYGPHNHHSVASNLAKAVSGQNEPIYFGTFYDPVQWWTRPGHEQPDQRDWHYSWEDAESASRELLRRQVEDFIEWLKGQGVI